MLGRYTKGGVSTSEGLFPLRRCDSALLAKRTSMRVEGWYKRINNEDRMGISNTHGWQCSPRTVSVSTGSPS